MTETSETSNLSRYSVIIISLISSIQMFLGNTRIFDNGFMEVLFSKGDTQYLNMLSFLYFSAVCVSLFSIFNIVFQRVFSKWRLSFFRPLKQDEELHIFFGETKYSKILTHEIEEDKTIIVIDYPTDKDADEVSFIRAVLNFYKRSERKKNRSRLNDKDGFFKQLFSYAEILFKKRKKSITYLKAKRKLSDVELSDKRIADILDLKGIDDLIFRNNTFLYFLSDNEQENIISINNIRLRVNQICTNNENNRKTCHIFCHAKKEGYNLSREDDYRNHFDIKFIDSSYLAIRQIICEDPNSLPVNFVKIAQDSGDNGLIEGYSLGYVESAFNAAIFGFGELGHDAFDFLFEYGAFVNKNHQRSPFHVYAYDKDVNNNDKAFKKLYPGIGRDVNKYITIDNRDFNKDSFWKNFKIKSLNYVFICTGNDDINCDILSRLDRCFKSNPETPIRIMVKHSAGNLAPIPESIQHIRDYVRFFGGDEDIWKYNIITDSALTTSAKNYFAAYKQASEGLDQANADEIWEEREAEIYSPLSDCATRKKRIRQRSQDFANCLHLSTKKKLIGEKFLEMAPALAQSILANYNNTEFKKNVFEEVHCERQPEPQQWSKKMLEYLAVCEHIRWVASHIVMGYSYGNQICDDSKTHNCLIGYDQITDRKEENSDIIYYGKVRHYDWIVIKTTLEMLANESSE